MAASGRSRKNGSGGFVSGPLARAQVCRNLSGGNQQKIVIARWLTAHSHIMILDHPTRGLDVGAKEEVYDMIRNLSAEGVAIVLTSDTLEETIGISHTILVMRDGEITGSLRRAAVRQAGASRAAGAYGVSAADGWRERRGETRDQPRHDGGRPHAACRTHSPLYAPLVARPAHDRRQYRRTRICKPQYRRRSCSPTLRCFSFLPRA